MNDAMSMSKMTSVSKTYGSQRYDPSGLSPPSISVPEIVKYIVNTDWTKAISELISKLPA